MAQHAKLSASGADRWLTCPGSVRAEEGVPEKSSPYAMEGTSAHELGELCLLNGRTAKSYLNTTLPESKWHVDDEMVEHVQTYVDYVEQFKGDRFIEQRVDFSEYVPDGFGTSDAIVITDKVMHIIDLKYGKGIRVDADNNAQGKLYALGALCDYGYLYDIQYISIHIVQPRIDNISVWEIRVEDLLKWAEWVRDRAQLCALPDAPRVASQKGCMWCKAKPSCPELMALTESALLADFDDVSVNPKSPDKLSIRNLRFALENKKLIISWLDAVEDLAYERLSAGEEFPGFKLVYGRSSRSWADPQLAEQVLVEALGAEAFAPKKIITAPQAEKALGKKRAALLDGLISKSEGAPTMVSSDDKRPEINSGDISDFD